MVPDDKEREGWMRRFDECIDGTKLCHMNVTHIPKQKYGKYRNTEGPISVM